MISNSGKNQKLILLLNKIGKSLTDLVKRLVNCISIQDLVPKENVKAWLKYLRPMYPTVAFKASTQNQNDKLVSNLSILDDNYSNYSIVSV